MVNVARVQTPLPLPSKKSLSAIFSEERGTSIHRLWSMLRYLDQNTDPHAQYTYRNISRRRA